MKAARTGSPACLVLSLLFTTQGTGAREKSEDIRIQPQENVMRYETTVDEKEGVPAAEVEPASPVKLGGALRFNYFLKDFDEPVETRRGDVGFDIFRVNADGQFDKLFLSADYRFYRFMDTIHHGYVGYKFDESRQIQAGITQVPFGLLPYAAHNYWFGVPYFVGLADDYDSGAKFLYRPGSWDVQLAFFKNAELGNAADLDRYSYDPVVTASAANEETNTFNARTAYTLNKGSNCEHEVGVSAEWGELFNGDTDEKGDRWAAATHVDTRCGRWNLQFQATRFEYDPRNPAGVSDDTITVGAFGASHEIVSQGDVFVANVAYNVPTPWSSVQLLTCYNDFSVLEKDEQSYGSSYLNTTGCLLQIGPTYTYVDLIHARNMVFFGDGSLADEGSDDWHTRFNVNFGIYW